MELYFQKWVILKLLNCFYTLLEHKSVLFLSVLFLQFSFFPLYRCCVYFRYNFLLVILTVRANPSCILHQYKRQDWQIKSERQQTCFYSQVTLKAISNPYYSLQLVTDTKLLLLKLNIKVRLQFVKVHIGTEGNETANKATKEAINLPTKDIVGITWSYVKRLLGK